MTINALRLTLPPDSWRLILIQFSGHLVESLAHHKIEIFVSRAEPSILKCFHRIDDHVKNLRRLVCLPNSDNYVDSFFLMIVAFLGKAPLAGCYWERYLPVARRRLHFDEAAWGVIAPGESTSGVAVTKIAAVKYWVWWLPFVSSPVF